MTDILPIFVYGTLMRGQVREKAWPVRPRRVENATTSGTLFDLGPYPALVEGNGVVAGELWHIALDDLAVTLERLDAIEGYLPEGNNLYERKVVSCCNEAGQMFTAFAYFYSRIEDLAKRSPVSPNADGCRRWQRVART